MRVAATLAICFVVCLVEVSQATRDGRRRQISSGSTVAPEACPRRACTKDCGTRGFMRGANGCEICACNPATNCPELECPDSAGVCPFGWKEDENGCRLCECKINPRCTAERPMCMMACADGFVNGPDGCPTCQCYDRSTMTQTPAPGVSHHGVTRSPTGGRHGARHHGGQEQHQHHRGGRSTTASPSASNPSASVAVVAAQSSADTSSPATCVGPICRMHCEYGMQLGDDGCPVCACNGAPTAAPEVDHRGSRGGSRHHSRRRGPQCFRPTCAMYCANGYRRDHTGCTLCECHQPGDPEFRVNTGSTVQCQPLQCHRTMRCAHGFVNDQSTGCPLCVCRRTRA